VAGLIFLSLLIFNFQAEAWAEKNETTGILAALSLPGESPKPQKVKAEYFDSESLQIEPLIRVQRAGYAFLDIFYGRVYPAWVWMGMAALLLSAFRRPFYTWAPLAAMVLLKMIFPLVIGFGMWRYVVAGIVPLEILAFAAIQVFLSNIFHRKVFYVWNCR
jgi:hypothetical protein